MGLGMVILSTMTWHFRNGERTVDCSNKLSSKSSFNPKKQGHCHRNIFKFRRREISRYCLTIINISLTIYIKRKGLHYFLWKMITP